VTALADRLDAALAGLGTKARAKRERAYLKSELVHYGVTVPALRAAVASVDRDERGLVHAELVATVEDLWSRGIYELRSAAVELLVRRAALLGRREVPLVERLIREARTWALVDVLAPVVMAGLLARDARLGRTLDRWARDPDFWIRRAALLTLLVPLRDGGGDFARFGRYADALLEDPEFFVRKAIGWVLRDTSKRRPRLVYDWLLPRAQRAAGLTVREATKYLTAAQQAAIRTARDTRRR
jgi:3-methyladenine DNA glycosylase AlkD